MSLNKKKTEFLHSIETALATVSVRKDFIIEIRFKQYNYSAEIKDRQEIHKAFLKLTNNGRIPYHVLIFPIPYSAIIDEPREMSILNEFEFKHQKSVSIVIHGLPQRILFSAVKFANYHFQLFNSKEVAMEWILNKIKNNCDLHFQPW